MKVSHTTYVQFLKILLTFWLRPSPHPSPPRGEGRLREFFGWSYAVLWNLALAEMPTQLYHLVSIDRPAI